MRALAMSESAETPHADDGKYRIIAELGEGGTAKVYLAVARGRSGFNKLVVLKTIKRNLADHQETRQMFVQEARLAARLNHPGIVQTYEIVEIGGLPVIVMEYLEGHPLSSLISRARQQLTLPMHLRIIADAASALHYAHELADYDATPLGLVHRDMTPHNVMVTFDGQTKILDFGIAKLATSRNETRTGVIKGKVRYMPPEQIAGEAVDRRTDLYAVGVMLWEAATGRQMWEGCTDITVMNRVLNGEIPAPRSLVPGIPEDLHKMCLKALSADPNERYATAADMEAEIEAFLEQMSPRVSQRATAKLVSQVFSDVRQKTKALVETQLRKIASLSSVEFEALQGPALPVMPVEGSMTDGGGEAPGTVANRSRLRRRLLGATGVVLVAVAAAALLRATIMTPRLTLAPSPSVPGSNSAQVSPPANGPGAASAHRPDLAAGPRVSVRISASPASARLFFDAELLPGNPFTRQIPSDGIQHIVRAEAEGYAAHSAAVVADMDREVTLELERLKPVAPEKPKTRAAILEGKARPASGPTCDPAYVLDQKGIKRFKPECL
jgi:serine/threonine-protein kinase